MLSLIVAMDQNRLIGNNNALPWHLPADLKYFKAATMSKPIVMGRKTYESIGKPLPGRRNIVVTRDSTYQAEGCEVVNDIDQALDLTAGAEEVMVIGGMQIYELALPRVSRMYLTMIEHEFAGDAWFPEFDMTQWREVSAEAHQYNADSLTFEYRFLVLDRIN